MNSFTPDQILVLRETLGDIGSKVESIISVPKAGIEQFIKNCEKFAQDHLTDLNGHPYILILDAVKTSSLPLNESEVLNGTTNNSSAFVVDKDLNFIRSLNREANISTCKELSQQLRTLTILIDNDVICIYAMGRNFDVRDLGQKYEKWEKLNYHHPSTEFNKILEDHMNAWVKNEGIRRYWYDREKRILLVDDGTELIFHSILYHWLKLFVSDAISVYAEPAGLGQDKTDINIVTVDRGVIVVEVKWLGKNQNKTEYKQVRIDEGLEQVSLYLNRNGDFSEGHLVIYDGRAKDIHLKESAYTETLRHEKCYPPHILFLESETPSVLATKKVKDLKKSKKTSKKANSKSNSKNN